MSRQPAPGVADTPPQARAALLRPAVIHEPRARRASQVEGPGTCGVAQQAITIAPLRVTPAGHPCLLPRTQRTVRSAA